jgi:HlyD family secretion protein
MDIPRKISARQRYLRRGLYSLVGLTVLVGITFGLSRLKPAAPSADRSLVVIDTVKRGSLVRQERGLGTLVPEDIRWIAAAHDGRVERILVLPGREVKAGTVLLELSNPDMELEAFRTEWQLKSAEAAFTDLRVRLESQRLDQQAATARVQADYNQAKLKAERNELLTKDGLFPAVDLQLSKEVLVQQLHPIAHGQKLPSYVLPTSGINQ